MAAFGGCVIVMANRRIRVTFVATLLGISCASSVFAQVPPVIQADLNKSHEALFSGDYPNALRRSENALEVLRQFEQGFAKRHLAEGLIKCLQSDIHLASGDVRASRRSLVEARENLKKRRGHPDQVSTQILEAYIDIADGDVNHHPPGHGVLGDGVAAIRESNRQAASSYQQAKFILDQLPPVNPGDDANVVPIADFQPSRLLARIALSMARLDLASLPAVGVKERHPFYLLPKSRDIEEYIQDVFFLLNANPVYQEFMQPALQEGKWPLSHKDLQDYENAKRRDLANAANKQQLADWEDMLRFAISDFVSVTNCQAEIEAIKDVCGQGGGAVGAAPDESPQMAEANYRSTALFLRDRYGPQHPLLLETETSLARWYAMLSTPQTQINKPVLADQRRRVSYARDVLFQTQKIRQQWKASRNSLPKPYRLELLRLDARALENLRQMDADSSFLSVRQREELTKAIAEIAQAINTLLEKS